MHRGLRHRVLYAVQPHDPAHDRRSAGSHHGLHRHGPLAKSRCRYRGRPVAGPRGLYERRCLYGHRHRGRPRERRSLRSDAPYHQHRGRRHRCRHPGLLDRHSGPSPERRLPGHRDAGLWRNHQRDRHLPYRGRRLAWPARDLQYHGQLHDRRPAPARGRHRHHQGCPGCFGRVDLFDLPCRRHLGHGRARDRAQPGPQPYRSCHHGRAR